MSIERKNVWISGHLVSATEFTGQDFYNMWVSEFGKRGFVDNSKTVMKRPDIDQLTPELFDEIQKRRTFVVFDLSSIRRVDRQPRDRVYHYTFAAEDSDVFVTKQK